MAQQQPGTPEKPNTTREYMLQCLARWIASRPLWERDKFLHQFEKNHTKELTLWLTRHSSRIATENAEQAQRDRVEAQNAARQAQIERRQNRRGPYQPPTDNYKPPPALTPRDKAVGRQQLNGLMADLFDHER